MKIALFGGSFDPPHKGHERLVLELLKYELDKVIIMPTFINPFKNHTSASSNLRLKWVKKLWSKLDKIEISDYEIKQEKPVPSIQSVEFLYQRYKNIEKFYLVIGADHLELLHKWHDFDRLQNLVEFIIAKRNNIKIPQKYKILDINIQISSSQIRQNLNQNYINNKIKNEVLAYYKGQK